MRVSARERLISWAFYDWADQAFVTLIHTFVFSVYFTHSVAPDVQTGWAYWGTAIGLAGIVVAIAAPLLGATADQGGRRKPWIIGFALLCIVTTALMWFVEPSAEFIWLAFVLIVLATIGSEMSVVFYNSLLPRLASPDRIGRWSGWAWGLGYAGGLLSLLIALFAFIRPEGAWLGLSAAASEHVRAVTVFVAIWHLAFALPLFIVVPDVPSSGKTLRRSMQDGLEQLWRTIRQIRRHADVLRFLIAHMFYINGLTTLFAFGGIYAAGEFGLSPEAVLILGIMLNIAAGIGAFTFAWIDDLIGSRATILIALTGLIISGSLILLVTSLTLFWSVAWLLGIFVGPAQAASRSFLAQHAPRDMQNQMFGFFALSGRATAFLGPLIAGWTTYLAVSQRAGMATIIAFFAIGLILMLTVRAELRGSKT